MTRPARCASRQGLLLVEAVLSAVVIAVGLVFISRGLANHLLAIRTVEDHQILLSLAQGKLHELEGIRSAGAAWSAELAGDFAEPYAAYRWEVTTAPRADVTGSDGEPLAYDATVTVARAPGAVSPDAAVGTRAAVIRLGAVWPAEWLR